MLNLAAVTTRLDELEAIVRAGQQTFLEVGRALLEIRDTEAFRDADYASFDAYLTGRWPQLSRRSLYNAIAAAGVDANGAAAALSPSHLVELARVPHTAEQRRLAALALAEHLTVRDLRAIIRDRQQASSPRRPVLLADRGSADVCTPDVTLEVGDARRLPFEDGEGHRDRRHGGPCEGLACPHPWLVLESPPYNAGVSYDADPTADCLPWRDYWHGLIVPHFREVYRVLPAGARFACNLPNVLRSDVGDRRRGDGDGTRHHRPYVLRGSLEKRQHAGAGGQSWAVMIDRLLWATWRRLGFLERERFTWVKVNGEQPESIDPRNTITESTAWGTWCSPENPVARAVAEPIYVASKGSYSRERPEGAESDLDRDTFLALTRNAWFIPNGVDRSRHPCPWPLGVPTNLMRLYTWPGDLTANFFEGSGTTAEAAVLLGRRHYGSDRSATYVHDAQHRVSAALEWPEAFA